jgi:L-seryl-tRNA(Ser) seleniumtransferase
MIMKVHTSNYVVQGFTAHVEDQDLAKIANNHSIAYVVDLGSGSLVDMHAYGLPKEPTPQEALKNGAHLVTFSGDKLLGGPQCGIIVGSKELILQIKKNPLKRMLRVSKLTLAALEAVLHLYRDPETLSEKLTVLAQLTRTRADITEQSIRVYQRVQSAFENTPLSIFTSDVLSQIGSGSLPVDLLPSSALIIKGKNKSGEKVVLHLEKLLRNARIPVIGRIKDHQLIFDLRCLRPDQEDILIQTIQNALKEIS